MNLQVVVSNLQKAMVRNSPAILMGLGVTGFVATIGFAIKATPKATLIVNGIDDELDISEDATNFELKKTKALYYVQKLGPIYAPAIVSGLITIGCFASANRINVKRNEMLIAAYSLSEKALRTYQNKVVDKLGEKKHLEVVDSMAEDKLRSVKFNPESVVVTTYGDTKCLDAWSGRYFLSDINSIRKSENEIIKRLRDGECCTVNDFYEELGLAATKGGEIIGWDPNDILIDVQYSPILDENDNPCLVIDFYVGVLENRYHIL